ncbi:MAG: hypothetical protein VR70_10595 [Rhodospirillaceae bacterium BRH_c57]|nr:MAG: hypothetical protein VR70_10595 [Rhodospirillaceae bacterium BRH_c57]
MHTVTVAPDVAQAGTVTLGILEARVVVRADDAELAALLATEADRAATRPVEDIAGLPAVAGTRSLYKALGKDPARYRPASEALLRRLAQGKGLYRVNTVVDINNLMSITTGLPGGTYDAALVQGDVVLRRGSPEDSYAGIGRGPLNLDGLPILADEVGAFGSPTSDSERTAITPETRRLLMILFGFGEGVDVQAPLGRAAELLARFAVADDMETRVLRV